MVQWDVFMINILKIKTLINDTGFIFTKCLISNNIIKIIRTHNKLDYICNARYITNVISISHLN